MSYSLLAPLLVGLAAARTAPTDPGIKFDDYGDAWKTAKLIKRPMLVILNPGSGKEDGKQPIELADVRKTRQRRELLESYVVAVIDTSTDHGKAVHEVFGKPQLPRVVIIDKEQKLKIFKTSDEMYGQLWTQVLQTYKKGEEIVEAKPVRVSTPSTTIYPSNYVPAQYCPT